MRNNKKMTDQELAKLIKQVKNSNVEKTTFYTSEVSPLLDELLAYRENRNNNTDFADKIGTMLAEAFEGINEVLGDRTNKPIVSYVKGYLEGYMKINAKVLVRTKPQAEKFTNKPLNIEHDCQ